MKKIVFLFATWLNSLIGFAQSTISYGQISSYCPQTGQMLGGGGAIAITFYDGYISHPLYGNLYATSRNNDGSTTYQPRQFAGSQALQLNAVLISSNKQKMEERLTSSMGYMSINMINTYTSMGEDGGRAAQQVLEAEIASRRGSVSSDRSHNNRNTTKICTSCGGTGVSKRALSGYTTASWVAHFNSPGNCCPYCNGYTKHWHMRCESCNVPRY